MTPAPSPSRVAESLLAFWRDAGIEWTFGDAPVDRTAAPPPPARAAVLRATAAVAAAPDAAACAVQARALAGACDTMETLVAAAAAFDGCGLKSQGARRAVVGAGPATADLLVVDAAPGAEADATGQVFAGPAGALIDRALTAAGLGQRAYRMNAVFWRPPGDRAAEPEEQAACLPFVERALAILRPKAVLLLGAAPARGLLGLNEPVMRLRGQWRDWRLAEGGIAAPVLVTLSPRFLLSQPLAKRQVWADLLMLAERLDR